MRSYYLCTACLILLALAGGCWDAQAVEDSAYVMMMGVDTIDEEGTLELTLDMVVPRLVEGLGGRANGTGELTRRPTFIARGRGSTLQLARAGAADVIPRELRFLHLRGIILGRELAESGQDIPLLIDWALRDPELRLDALVYAAREPAGELLRKVLPPLEQVPGLETERLLDIERLSGHAAGVTVRDIADAYYGPFQDPMAPVLALVDPATGMPAPDVGEAEAPGQPGLRVLRVRDTALFDAGGSLVGFLEGPALRGGNWLRGGVLGDVSIDLEAPAGQDASATIQLLRVGSRSAAEVTDDGLRLQVRTRVQGAVADYTGATPHSSPEDLQQMERRLAAAMEEELLAALGETQTLGVDPFGFAKRLYESQPPMWRQLRATWPAHYAAAELDVAVTASIKRTGLGR